MGPAEPLKPITYGCRDCGYHLTRISSEPPELRLPCISCESWMYPCDHNGEPMELRKVNTWFWELLWRIIEPFVNWVDRHTPDDEDDEV